MKENKLLRAIWIILAAFVISGCSPRNETDSQKLYLEQQYNSAQLNVLFLRDLNRVPLMPDETYQLVNEMALQSFYKIYSKELFDKNVVGWESNFDCNRFSQYYAALSQINYFKDNFRSGRAQAIAIGEVYYKSKTRGKHAINFAVTPNRIVFIEPQTGAQIDLTKDEIRSIFFIKL